jgi:hypothetical protein
MRLSVIGCIFSIALVPNVSMGQTRSGNRAPGTPDQPGNMSLFVEPRLVPTSLLDLIRKSELIIDGTVLTPMPSVDTRKIADQSSGPPLLETDSVITVNQVIAGEVPGGATTIALAQSGGKLGKWNITVPEDPLVVTGERYILFLNADTRKNAPSSSGLSRYSVLGIWSGKFKVSGGLVQVSAHAQPPLKSFDGNNVNSFIQALKTKIEQPYSERDRQLPIQPPVK